MSFGSWTRLARSASSRASSPWCPVVDGRRTPTRRRGACRVNSERRRSIHDMLRPYPVAGALARCTSPLSPCPRAGVGRARERLLPMSGVATRAAGYAGGDVEQVVLLDGLPDEVAVDVAPVGERLQRPDRHRVRVDEDLTPRGRSGVGKAEAVGTEGVVLAGHPRPDGVLDLVLEVRRRHVRAAGVAQFRRHVRLAGLLLRVEEV